MDSELARLIAEDTPKINPSIGHGLAVEHMKQAEKYIDDVFRAAAQGFPPGLEYVGCKRCTPQEEFDENTKSKNNKRVFDVARSNIYMMKYLFRWKGADGKVVDLPPRYLYLPFVEDAGTITLGGSRFNISPILSDRVISIGVDNIFVRLLRDRLTFERFTHYYMENDQRTSAWVAHSLIYHKNPKEKKAHLPVKANCTLMHYLLCKYGFKDTFLKFANCTPVVGGEEINHSNHPADEWVICSTSYGVNYKPKGLGRGFYKPSQLRVAIKREEYTPKVRSMICGFFYVVDHFPEQVQPEWVENRDRWMDLMGTILWGNMLLGQLHEKMKDHISSLDEYLDVLVRKKLTDINHARITNVYELFDLVIENIDEWLVTAKDKIASMYDKELSILYYVLFDITTAIFRLYFKLKAQSKKELTQKEIIATMNLTLRTGLVFSITKNHPEVSTISVPGDNKAFKVTALLKPQTATNKNVRKDRASINDPTKRLHASVAEVGGYANLPKAAPDGRERLNPTVEFDHNGVIVRSAKRRELLDEVQRLIQRQ